jgi:protein-S-isoprenylcysteine O-methyltransferase Ste14
MNAESPAQSLLAQSLARGAVEVAISGCVLFGIAGRVNWSGGWLILLLFAGHTFLSGWWLSRRDPELLKERLTTASNVPQWDRLIWRGNRISLVMLLATAALDAGRFRWSAMPTLVQMIGTAAVVAALPVIWWCGATNRFLSGKARIQSERGHTVVQDGPYRFVRHPLYAVRVFSTIGAALALGSWLALVPAALNVVLLVLRTSLEDRLLTAELPGYRQYAEHVPARMVPGLW